MAYFVLNIQICPVLDEDLYHLQMACISGPRKSSISNLPETDTHSERNATACHHTLPPYRLLSIYKHTYIHTYVHTFIRYAYSKTLAHPYITVYIHTLWASMQTAHTEIHRSHIQAITYAWTYIDTDKHPN